MSSYQYRKSHCGDKTILRPSYLHNGISYTGQITFLYWIGARDIGNHHADSKVTMLSQQLHYDICNMLQPLTHHGLVIPYGNTDLGQHRLRQWLVAWWHQVLPEPMFTYCQRQSLAFPWEQLHELNPEHVFRHYTFKISTTSPRGPWVKQHVITFPLTLASPSATCYPSPHGYSSSCGIPPSHNENNGAEWRSTATC